MSESAKTWQLIKVPARFGLELAEFLDDGWEPFAITYAPATLEVVWLRRLV